MLALVFSCCGLRHRPDVPPDERTPLIPHSDDSPTSQPRVIDPQRLKERLGSVVRSKEGKMVNVNAQFPFDRHYASARPSRNHSADTLPSSRTSSPSPHPDFSPDGTDALHYLPLAATSPALNVRLIKSTRYSLSARGRPLRSGDPYNRSPALASQSELVPDEEHTPRTCLERATHLPLNPDTPHHHPEDFTILDAGAVARSWGD